MSPKAFLQAKQVFKALFASFQRIPAYFWGILALFVATRIALTVIGLVARNRIKMTSFAYSLTGISWLDIWGAWDSQWYLNVADSGYSAIPFKSFANYGFFPLYPMLMRWLGALIGSEYVAGILISNTCFIAACVLFYKLVRLDEDKNTAMRAVKFLILFPGAFFFSAVYSEPLFLLLCLACFYYARKQNWVITGILGLLLSLTRYIGFLALIPLAWEYLASKNFKIGKVRLDALLLLLLPLGFVAFMFFIYKLTGDPLAYLHIEKECGYLEKSLITLFTESQNALRLVSGSFLLAGGLLLAVFFRKIRFSYWILSAYSLIIPVATVAISGAIRYLAIVFPLFIILGRICKNRHAEQAVLVFFALLQGLLMAFWTVGSAMII